MGNLYTIGKVLKIRTLLIIGDLQDTLTDHSMAEELGLICSDPEEIEREYDLLKNFGKKIK